MFLIIYIIAGSVAFLFTAVIFATLRRTKRIPYAARLLSSGLLIFDMTFTVAVITREVVTDVVINLHCHVITMIALQLAFSTVALMSIERYVVLNWPNKIYLFIGHIRNDTAVDYSIIVFCDMLKQVMYEIYLHVS